jgi:hypothetical protein
MKGGRLFLTVLIMTLATISRSDDNASKEQPIAPKTRTLSAADAEDFELLTSDPLSTYVSLQPPDESLRLLVRYSIAGKTCWILPIYTIKSLKTLEKTKDGQTPISISISDWLRDKDHVDNIKKSVKEKLVIENGGDILVRPIEYAGQAQIVLYSIPKDGNRTNIATLDLPRALDGQSSIDRVFNVSGDVQLEEFGIEIREAYRARFTDTDFAVVVNQVQEMATKWDAKIQPSRRKKKPTDLLVILGGKDPAKVKNDEELQRWVESEADFTIVKSATATPSYAKSLVDLALQRFTQIADLNTDENDRLATVVFSNRIAVTDTLSKIKTFVNEKEEDVLKKLDTDISKEERDMMKVGSSGEFNYVAVGGSGKASYFRDTEDKSHDISQSLKHDIARLKQAFTGNVTFSGFGVSQAMNATGTTSVVNSFKEQTKRLGTRGVMYPIGFHDFKADARRRNERLQLLTKEWHQLNAIRISSENSLRQGKGQKDQLLVAKKETVNYKDAHERAARGSKNQNDARNKFEKMLIQMRLKIEKEGGWLETPYFSDFRFVNPALQPNFVQMMSFDSFAVSVDSAIKRLDERVKNSEAESRDTAMKMEAVRKMILEQVTAGGLSEGDNHALDLFFDNAP